MSNAVCDIWLMLFWLKSNSERGALRRPANIEDFKVAKLLPLMLRIFSFSKAAKEFS